MSIGKSLQDIKNKEINAKIEKFKKNAIEYASQGFDEDLVAELLQADGCDIDLSKKIAQTGIDEMPEGYAHDMPPESYEDIKDKIDRAIRNDSIENIEKIVNSKELSDLVKMARDAHSEEFFDQVHRDIKEIVDGMIYDNTALAHSDTDLEEPSEREKIAEKVFGVWTANTIKNFMKKESVKNKIIKQTNSKNNIFSN